MARYIDADAFIEDIQETICAKCGDISDGIKCKSCGIDDTLDFLENAPTADVVPKREVEELQAKVARLRKENTELLVSKETDIHISMEKLVKVRTEHPIFKAIEEKVAREIFEEIEKITMHNVTSSYGIWLMSMGEDAFAELKKKYTEETE